MEGLLPATITPVTALQQLKEMMQKREGDWLVGPVTVEGDCLVTSDKAFDEISKKYAISKHVLRGLLHGGQRKPFLRIKQQKLYLQMEAN